MIEDVLVNNDVGQAGEQEWNASVLNKTKPDRTAWYTKVTNALIYLFKKGLADMYEINSHGIVKELSEGEKKEKTIKIKYGLNIINYVDTVHSLYLMRKWKENNFVTSLVNLYAYQIYYSLIKLTAL